jgi:glutamyl-tRNA reductase
MSVPESTASPRARILQVGVDLASHGLAHLAALHAGRQSAAAALSLPPGAGVVPVATCHRLELYLHEVTERDAAEVFERWVGGASSGHPLTVRCGDDVVRHLLRVAAGLESAVLGEDQILAQLRGAYRAANAAGLTNGPLHRLFHAAFRVGRRVRSETELAGGVRSLAGAAVAVVNRRVGSLRGRPVLVLGAGEMAQLAARALVDREVGRLVIANRSPDRAAALAQAVGGECTPWEWRATVLPLVDVVICATSATHVIDPEALACAAHGRSTPLIVADLGVPPNIGAHDLAGIEIFDVATFASVLNGDVTRRRDAIDAAEAIIAQEVPDWLSRAAAPGACSDRACGARSAPRCRVG